MRRSLTDPEAYIGTVTAAAADAVSINLPFAAAKPETRRLSRGTVGDFVFVDCQEARLLGRIVSVRVPEADRLALEPKLGNQRLTNPLGTVQLFATVAVGANTLIRGVSIYPRVGDTVYLADLMSVSELIQSSVGRDGDVLIEVGALDPSFSSTISISASRLLGRHCGILGATGGGKSWTVATIIEQIGALGGKAIIFDPTGEFRGVNGIDTNYSFDQSADGDLPCYFPYLSMTESDLFALVNPSGQSQGPRLRDAVQSLKLLFALRDNVRDGLVVENGILKKAWQPRLPYYDAIDEFSETINSPLCRFNIDLLADQVVAECVGYGSNGRWGSADDRTLGYCETMIARIRTIVQSRELRCLFGQNGENLARILNRFVQSEENQIIRLSFKNVSFEHNTREILLNIVGRFLLNCARDGRLNGRPVVVFLDEAHQFMGKTVGDIGAAVSLDAFGLIAKEGRKYGLSCVLATQRPRDIPGDVLSQLGTLIVHRLTNENDRSVVERACGDLDREAARFVPTLGPGEAIVIGPDLPAPLPIKIRPPKRPPKSDGPNFAKHWGRGEKVSPDKAVTAPQSPPPAPPPPVSRPPAEPPSAADAPAGETDRPSSAESR